MKNRLRLDGLILAGLAMGGCATGPQDRDFVGAWEGKLKVPMAKPAADPEIPGDKMTTGMAKMAEGLAQALGNAQLELREDRTFDMSLIFIPIEGTRKRAGSTITPTPTKAMGLTHEETAKLAKEDRVSNDRGDLSEPMRLTYAADGKTLAWQDPKEPEFAFVFTRLAEKAKA